MTMQPNHAAVETGTTLSERIDELVKQHGSLRKASRVLEVDAGYLTRLRSGERDDPGAGLLRRMGLRRTVTFQRITPTPATGDAAT